MQNGILFQDASKVLKKVGAGNVCRVLEMLTNIKSYPPTTSENIKYLQYNENMLCRHYKTQQESLEETASLPKYEQENYFKQGPLQ